MRTSGNIHLNQPRRRNGKSQGLPGLLRIVDSGLTVIDLAEGAVSGPAPTWTTTSARTWLTKKGFDVAPVLEAPVRRYVVRDELSGRHCTVDDAAHPIDAACLVSSNLGLADAIALFETQPWYFVIAGRDICGIATRADLQRPAVSMIALAFILNAELAINSIVASRLGPEWLDHLSAKQQKKVERIYNERLAANVEIGRLECLMLYQRLDLLRRCESALEPLGFPSGTGLRRWKRQLCALRDVLAHGGTILDAETDPAKAVELFANVREFAKATALVAANL